MLRNQFEHFAPKGWSIEIHGLPEMAIQILTVVRALALETGAVLRLGTSGKRKVSSLVARTIGLTGFGEQVNGLFVQRLTTPPWGKVQLGCPLGPDL